MSVDRRQDTLNLALICAVFAFLILLIPPTRNYPMFDDWAYAQATKSMLGGAYVRHDWAVASSLVPISLGALASILLGYDFTSLTFVCLAFAFLGVVCFYLLLRQLGLRPVVAMLGSACLGLNPLYVFLSYSFMTDVPFVALLLLASLLFVRGFQTEHDAWLWLGSLATSAAFLTRQYGLILAPVALGYLWWKGLWSWRRAVSIAAVPLVVFAVYTLWESTQPIRLELYLEAKMGSSVSLLSMDWLLGRAQRLIWVLTSTGLWLLPVLRVPRRPLLSIPLMLLVLLFQVRSLVNFGTLFPSTGSILDHTGFAMFEYGAAPVLNEQVWTISGLIGGVAASLALTSLGEHAWGWLRSGVWQQRSACYPVQMLYVFGILLAGGIFNLTPFIFDRYILPVLPFMIIACLLMEGSHQTPARTPSRSAVAWLCWIPVTMLAVFTMLALPDYKEHAAARWHSAQNLVSKGVPPRNIDAGFEWLGWQLYEDGASYVRQSGDYSHAGFPPDALLDPVYLVSDTPANGYVVLGSTAYTSWLSGGQVRYIYTWKRR